MPPPTEPRGSFAFRVGEKIKGLSLSSALAGKEEELSTTLATEKKKKEEEEEKFGTKNKRKKVTLGEDDTNVSAENKTKELKSGDRTLDRTLWNAKRQTLWSRLSSIDQALRGRLEAKDGENNGQVETVSSETLACSPSLQQEIIGKGVSQQGLDYLPNFLIFQSDQIERGYNRLVKEEGDVVKKEADQAEEGSEEEEKEEDKKGGGDDTMKVENVDGDAERESSNDEKSKEKDDAATVITAEMAHQLRERENQMRNDLQLYLDCASGGYLRATNDRDERLGLIFRHIDADLRMVEGLGYAMQVCVDSV